MARPSWLSLILLCLLLGAGISGATELEGFDEVEEEAATMPEPTTKVANSSVHACTGFALNRATRMIPIQCVH